MSSFSTPEPDATFSGQVAVPVDPAAPIQPFAPGRVGAALVLGSMLWIAPFYANNLVLLPARLQQIAPDEKVGLVALLAVVGSIIALLANVLFGALSDRTRSRFGRRTPWMISGSIGAALSLVALSLVGTVPALVLAWCCFQLFLNAIVAPLITVLADRVPAARRGLFSALYGAGVILGALVGQLTASAFTVTPQVGTLITAGFALLAGPVSALLLRERSSLDLQREPLSVRVLLSAFAFPRNGARDYYFAISGKLLSVLGVAAVTGYQLYILTDYLKLSLPQAGAMTATLGIIQLVTALTFGFAAGPISDRRGRRKVLVIISAVLTAVGLLIPTFSATTLGIMLFGVFAGLGVGVFTSIDQALNTEVLPNPDTAAKDLGIMNMANTGGQILGPAVTSGVLAITGGYAAVFPVAAVIVLLGAVLIAQIRSVR